MARLISMLAMVFFGALVFELVQGQIIILRLLLGWAIGGAVACLLWALTDPLIKFLRE